METVTPTWCSTARAKRASTTAGGAPCSASVPARSSTASSIDSGCTSGVRSCISDADLAGGRGVFAEIGLDDDRVGAGLQRLEHRHRAAHAIDAGDVAGRGDHPADAAADDDRAWTAAPAGRASRRWRRTRRSRHGRWSAASATGDAPAVCRRNPGSEIAITSATRQQSRQRLGIGHGTGTGTSGRAARARPRRARRRNRRACCARIGVWMMSLKA